jgi:hypothetical protein
VVREREKNHTVEANLAAFGKSAEADNIIHTAVGEVDSGAYDLSHRKWSVVITIICK